MSMSEVMRRQREALGMTQSDLAEAVGVDKRQIRRYEAGDTQPTLAVAVAMARTLGISVDELAGETTHRVDLTGTWWACWQSYKDGVEVFNPQPVEMRQQGDLVHITALERGTPLEDGGYLWRGEMKVWDNEIVMGWYVASEGAVRSKGTMYFVLHQHGIHLTGRWVGLSYDGPIITGWAAIARDEQSVIAVMSQLTAKGNPTHEP